MNFAIVCFAVCMSATLVSSQFFGSYNNNFGGLGLNSIDGGDFGGANVFGSLNSRPNIRDPRQNRGPVVFPSPPADGPVESSGVIIGGSGFGFVPPNGGAPQQNRFRSHRFNNRYFNQLRLF